MTLVIFGQVPRRRQAPLPHLPEVNPGVTRVLEEPTRPAQSTLRHTGVGVVAVRHLASASLFAWNKQRLCFYTLTGSTQ